MNSSQSIFLHLSDIHFKPKSDLDPNSVLQAALVSDAEMVAQSLNKPTGILITGDIAFSGQPKEYETARNWLEQLCEAVEIGIERVRTVPGNHDVDRNVVKNNPLLISARNQLRASKDQNELDQWLKGYLEKPASYDVLMSPTDAYNEFAGPLGCALTQGELWWREEIDLNDGSKLRISGLHSALTCDGNDSKEAELRKMILGSAQANLGHHDGVTHLVMCHHPFDWMRFEDDARQTLDAYAAVQLFGHKHRFDFNILNSKTLHLSAGAVQPDRDDAGWEPRYNFLGLSVDEIQERRTLKVEVWPRVWNQRKREFGPDYSMLDGASGESKIFDLHLRPWRKRKKKSPSDISLPTQTAAIAIEEQGVEVAVVEEEIKTTNATLKKPQTETKMQAKRKLIYVYLNLPYATIIKIASELSLMREEDRGISDQELYQRIMERADKGKLLGKLWDQVSQYAELPTNPFVPSVEAI